MKRLLLVRHAKASPGSALIPDRDRALSRRGASDAEALGAWLAASEVRPELVLCSSARRARETWERLRPSLPDDPAVWLDDALYLAPANALLEHLRRVDDAVRAVLLVAHNPGLGDLASGLAGSGDAEAYARLRAGFPSGAVADLVAPRCWRDLGPGSCELRAFVGPERASVPAG
jgi:phosphohistidine phosphatase